MAEHLPEDPQTHAHAEVDHGDKRFNAAAIVKFGIGLVVFAVIVHFALAWFYGILDRKTQREQPRLTPIAKKEYERKQQEAMKRLQDAAKNPESTATPQPAQVFERIQSIRGPRLQINDEADLRALRAEEKAKLEGYRWVDRKAGIVHIPIEEAMKKLGDDPQKARALGIKIRQKSAAKKGER
jgi:hypothetical protein